jgi:hypothetical protein
MKENMEPGTITDIDGFTVDESRNRVTSLIQKREYDVESRNSVLNGEKAKIDVLQSENEEEWKLRLKISEILNVPLYLALWPIDYPIREEFTTPKPIIVYRIISRNANLVFEPQFNGCIKELTTFIRKLRGGRSFGSIKNLKVATTMMECHLAKKTEDPWPGNLDAAIFDEKKEEVTAIIEFKTHNYPEYPIHKQYFGQWPGDDRRYRVLDIMQKHLEANCRKPKFVYVIWGTDKSHLSVRLQTIDNLKPSDDKYINRPEFTTATTADFTKELLGYIES